MKKRALKKKRIRLLLGCLVVMGLALGVGYGLKARAEDSQNVKKSKDNTKLGIGDIVNDGTSMDVCRKNNGDKDNQHYFRSYVYLGQDADGSPLKFQVINKDLYKDQEGKYLMSDEALLLDCMSVLETSLYEKNGTTVIEKLNGSHFYTNDLTETEKNAIIKRTNVSTNKEEAISLPWYVGEYSEYSGINKMASLLSIKDQAYWARTSKDDHTYVDAEGNLPNPDISEDNTDSYGISPSLLLDQKKILFSTKFDSDAKNGKEERRVSNDGPYLYKDAEYKLTLIDDKLTASVSEEKSVTMGDGKVSVPYTISDKTGDTRTSFVSFLVTDGEWNASGSSIVSYQYISTDTESGTAEFRWDKDWSEYYYDGKYHVYLIAEKQSNDYSVDAASNPVELTITKQLKSIEMTFKAPMHDDTWKTGDLSSIAKLIDNKDCWSLKVTGVNETSFSTDESLKNLLAFSDGYLKDHDSSVDFNKKYTMGLGIEINSDMPSENQYSFADEVTINLKIISSDDEKEADVKPVEIKVKNSGEVTLYDDTEAEIKENSTTRVYFNFNFTTRKAKVLSIDWPTQKDDAEAIDVNYAPTFDKVLSQLKEKEAKVTVEKILNGKYSPVDDEEISVNWQGVEGDEFKEKETNGQEFVVWGTLKLKEGQPYDVSDPYVYAKVNMGVQETLRSPAVFIDIEGMKSDIVQAGQTEVPGESAKLTITVPTNDERSGDDEDATIYYTLDDTDPTAKDENKYERDKGIVLSEDTCKALEDDGQVTIKLKAMAVREDWVDSEVSTATIVFYKKNTVTVTDATIKDRTEEKRADEQAENTHIYEVRGETEITLLPEDKSNEGKEFTGWKINDKEKILDNNTYTTERKDIQIEAVYNQLEAPKITTVPKNKTVTDGGSTEFTVQVTSPEKYSDSLSYQWQKKEVGAEEFTNLKDSKDSISGANADTLTLTGLTYSQNGEEYRCIVKYKEIDGKTEKEAEASPSTSAILTVDKAKDKLTIKTNPQDVTIKEKTDAVFTVEAEVGYEGDSLSYQWQKAAKDSEEFTDIEGATEATYTLFGASMDENGTKYQCLVKEVDEKETDETKKEVDSKTSESARLIVENAYSIDITKQPENATVSAGKPATFSVEASSSYEMVYEWQADYHDGKGYQKVGSDSAYTIKKVSKDLSGTTFKCIISLKENPETTVTSQEVVLNVDEADYTVTVNKGTASPESCKAGDIVSIKAEDAEEGKVFKKWKVVKGSVNLEDAASPETSFVMPKEDVELTAVYEEDNDIQITVQPENASVASGKSATFSVEATSSHEMVYEWQADYHDGKGYQKVGSDSIYTIKKVSKDLSGTTFKCVISLKENSDISVTSQEVVLNVDGADYTVTVNKGTASPESCKAGDTVTIKAEDAEEGMSFKKWKIVKGDVKLEDAESAETSFVMPKEDVELTAVYKEDSDIQITAQPENVSIPEGGSASFTVVASSSHELSYQWQEDKGDGKGFQNVGNEETYTIASVTSDQNGARYQCVITAKDDEEMTITSSEAVLTVTASTYTIKVNNGTGSASDSVAGQVITVTANDAPEGQEFEKWVVVRGKANLADITSKETTFTMPAANVELDVKYRNQIDGPTISKQPQSVTVYAGSSTSFTVEASGEEISYQWQVDKGDGSGFQDISGASSATYRVYTEDCSMNGYRYQCLVSNRAGTATSEGAILTVSYKITQGAGASWQKNSSSGLTFKGSGAYDKFKSVKIDGERLSGSNYTKSADPTVINLSATYLQTLTNGTHTLTLVWEDGSAEAEFSVSGTATGSSSTTASSSGTSKSSASSGSTGTSSDKAKTSNTKSKKESGTTDMPIVNKSKSSTKDSITKTTGSTNKGNAGSVKTLEEGDYTGSSRLNRYAAIISLVVVAGCGLGGGATLLVRKLIRRKEDEDLF